WAGGSRSSWADSRRRGGLVLVAPGAGGVEEAVAQLVARDHLDQPRALDLAGRGLGNRAGAHQQDAGGPVPALLADPPDDLAHEPGERLALARLLAPPPHPVQPLGAGAFALHPDRRRVADARHVVHDLFDVGRVHVLAAQDDHVLEAARDVEKALRVDEAQVAGAEPAVGGEHLRGRGRVVVVTLNHARTLHADLGLDALFDLLLAVHDAHPHAAAWLAHRE